MLLVCTRADRPKWGNNVKAFQKMTSEDFERQGLTGANVENLQVQAVKMELQRER